MGGWWVSTAWEVSPALLAAWVFWVLGSITLHELAHGWTAIRCGDRTPIELGRMTPNPVVHMGPMSLIVFGLIGIAWGSMPVDPSRLRGRHDDAAVALAGPAMNVSLALACCVALAIWRQVGSGLGVSDNFYSNVALFFYAGAWLNVALAIFNLVPVPPLDGSRILASYSYGYARLFSGEQGQMMGLAAFIALFWFGGRFLFPASQTIVDGVLAVLPF